MDTLKQKLKFWRTALTSWSRRLSKSLTQPHKCYSALPIKDGSSSGMFVHVSNTQSRTWPASTITTVLSRSTTKVINAHIKHETVQSMPMIFISYFVLFTLLFIYKLIGKDDPLNTRFRKVRTVNNRHTTYMIPLDNRLLDLSKWFYIKLYTLLF